MEYLEAKFGEVVVKNIDPRVAKRYAELKLPGVDRRFFVAPEFVDTQQPEQVVGLDNV